METRRVNEQVKRNPERFPDDFVFQLTKDEYDELRSQNATFKSHLRKYLPYAFTEQGVAMLSSVLKSKQAAHVNVLIMRAFVRLRRLIASNTDLAKKIEELSAKLDAQGGVLQEHGEAIAVLFYELRRLIQPETEEEQQTGRIGYKTAKRKK